MGTHRVKIVGALAFLLLFCLSVRVVYGHRSGGYCHDSTIGYSNPDWMGALPDGLRISALSIPGTHDTMAFHGGDAVQCQSMSLSQQLLSGIRVLDVRCRHIEDVFAIHHGAFFQHAFFGEDVLRPVNEFLSQHPNETILMRVKEEYNPAQNTRSFAETFEWYMSLYGQRVWQPTGDNPKLGEVRGKIVILDNFTPDGTYGLRWDDAQIQDQFNLTTNWDLDNKWLSIEQYLLAADAGDMNELYINFLSGSGGSFPYFVASGHSSPGTGDLRLWTGMLWDNVTGSTCGSRDCYPFFPRLNCIGPSWWRTCSVFFEGTNEILTYYWIKAGRVAQRTGIVMADFPGPALLEEIINLNSKLIPDQFYLHLPVVLRGAIVNSAPDVPSAPSPPDESTDQPTMLTLTWAGGDPDGDAVTYDVTLDPGDDTPETVICDDVLSPSCDPGMLVTGTPYYWQVIATDEHSATTAGPVWAFATTLRTCEDGIGNGGFEVDGEWELPVTAYRAAYSTAEAHGGSRSMRVGIVSGSENKYSFSSARQWVTIPADAESATLRFWLYALSGEASTRALTVPERPVARTVEEAALLEDAQYVLILDEEGDWIDTVLWQRRDDQAWSYHEADLLEYAGETIKLHFGVYNDGLDGATGMYVDDVSLVTCTTPPPNQPPYAPSAPSPPDGSTDQPTMLTLTWAGGDPDGDAVTYDVTLSGVTLDPGDDPPETVVCDDVPSPSCDPGMLVTGTHYYWQVVATDKHSATTAGPVWAFTTTLRTCEDGIGNGGFEIDGEWELPVTAYRAAYSTAEAHGGSRSMRVGIVSGSENKYSFSSARQWVTIPADAESATLRFWLYALSGEASTRALTVPERPLARSVEEAALVEDAQYVLILDEDEDWIDTVLWQRRNDLAWTYHEADLLDYAGETIKLHFGVSNDGLGGATGMYVDDVSLVLCSP
jgi:1-phosphatidylinositol phosphodiesterase